MAERLRRELKLRDALITYLEICHIDLNGPNNLGGLGGKAMPGFPAFDPRTGILAPGIIDDIRRIQSKLSTNSIDIQELYINHNRKIGQSLKLPLTSESTWRQVKKVLSEKL